MARLAAAATILLLAWETPYAVCAALKRQKVQKKKKKGRERNEASFKYFRGWGRFE